MTAQFDWNSFEPVTTQKAAAGSQESPKSQPEEKPQEFNWNSFEKAQPQEKKEERGMLKEAGRHVSRAASRVAETLGGIPGDIVKLAETVSEKLPKSPEWLSGKPNFIQEKGKELLKKIPGSEYIREFTKDYFEGFTEPQNEYEKIGDEVIQDIASLVGPGKFKKSLYVSLGANAVKQGSKALGFDEGKQNIGKLGTMFALSMINPKGVQNIYNNKYDILKKTTPNIDLQVPNLERELTSLEDILRKGVSVPTKTAVLKPIEELKGKIKNGTIPAEELVQARFDINNLMGDPELLKYGKHQFPKLSKAINKSIQESPQLGKDFKKNFISADEAYSALHQSKKASRFLNKLHPVKSSVVAAMIEGIHFPEAIPLTAAGLGAGFSIVKAYELMQRVNANPTMRKYYVNMIKSALDENKVATLRNFNALEKKLKEDNPH